MGVPFNQMIRVGSYVVKQHLKGTKRYPLVLMLERSESTRLNSSHDVISRMPSSA